MNFFKSVLWSLSGTIGVRIIGLLTSVVLARLLTPDIFGIVGMALVVVGFIYIIQEAGLSSFLIQTKELSKEMISTSFFLNIILSVILVIITFFSAPYIAGFYNVPQLELILYFSCAGIFIASFGITQKGILMREKQFRKIAIIDMVAELTTSIVSIALAIMGYPILAVGISTLFRPAVQSISLVVNVGIRSVFGKPDTSLIKEVFAFSINVLGTRVLNYVRNNIDYLLIGKLLGSTSLGLYTIAFQWSTVARFYFSQSIANVAFPEVARHQDNTKKVGQIYLNLIEKISFITFPICIGIALIAPEFVDFLYGSEWKSVVPVMQILMLSGLISSIGTIVGAILKGIGRPGVELQVNTYSLISFSILVLLGSYFGIQGVAYAVLINSFMFNFIMTARLLPLIEIKWSQYFQALKRSAYSTIIMAVLIYLFRYFGIYSFGDKTIVALTLLVISGIIFYILASYLFNKEMIYWTLSKIQPMLKKQSNGEM